MTTDNATLVQNPPPTSDDEPAGEPVPVRPRDIRRGDWLAALGYLLMAFVVTSKLWLHPHGVMLRENRQDNIQFEWVLLNSVRTLRHLSDPFFTDLFNAPFGVNLMANTSVWGLAIPLAPATALLGPSVAFRIMLTGAYLGTALAWYHVLSRYIVSQRVAAFVGAGFCAFAPGMLGQGTGHPNVVAQFVFPFIVLVLLRMREPSHPVRNGLLLAGLVAYQIFVNEESLLIAAGAIGVFVVAFWVQRPRVINPVVRSSLVTLAVTTGAVLIITGYPLYRQFFGKQSYRGLPYWVLDYNTDVYSYVGYAQQSLAGSKGSAQRLAQGVSEQNTFYGWGLAALVLVAVVWLWRRVAVRAVAATGAVFLLLSLGRYLTVRGHQTGVRGPWKLLSRVPLLDTVVPTRLSLVVIPIVGILIAFFVERIMSEGAPVGAVRFWTPTRVIGAAALVAALVPIAPKPLAVSPRHVAPAFFSSGAWRDYAPEGGTIGLVPFGWQSDLNMMQWQAEQGLDFKILNGYFLGPDPSRADKQAKFGAGDSLIRSLLDEYRANPVTVSASQRAECVRELRSWHTDALVLPADAPHVNVLRDGVDQILGGGHYVEGSWVWRIP